MKKIITIAMIVFSMNAFGQAPDWAWAKSAGGSSQDEGKAIKTDLSGNVFVIGNFQSPSINYGTTTLTNVSSGTADIFIVKYSPSGNVLWAKSGGGSNDDYGNSISTDASGNLFVTGLFHSTTLNFGTVTLTNSGVGADIFIVKYSPSGNVLWAKSAGGTSYDGSFSISTDTGGNAFVTGGSSSTSITFGTTTLSNGGGYNIFTAKYDALGNVLWAKSAVGTSSSYGNGVCSDASGNVIVTGEFGGSIAFGTFYLTNTYSYTDIFIVKYDALGNVLWAKSAGGNDWDYGRSVATDAFGNVFITGYFLSSTVTFGNIPLTNPMGSEVVFIVKYDAAGNVLWGRSAEGTTENESYSISTNGNGDSFLTGMYSSATIFFGGSVSLQKYPGYGDDIFVVKYDPSGNVLWATTVGGPDDERGYSVSTDANGNVFLTGWSKSPSYSFGTTTLTIAGTSNADMFISKLNSTTGIEELQNGDFTIAPNPFTFQTTITFSAVQKNSTIIIVDLLGKEIKRINFTGTELILEKGIMTEGIYFVQTTDEQKHISIKKVVIQ